MRPVRATAKAAIPAATTMASPAQAHGAPRPRPGRRGRAMGAETGPGLGAAVGECSGSVSGAGLVAIRTKPERPLGRQRRAAGTGSRTTSYR